MEEGAVSVDGLPARKAATLVSSDQTLRLETTRPRWASRGAHKLHGVLPRLGVAPAGRDCLDAGAAHGGFTDVLLRAGAKRVLAVDVGYGQLAWRLRRDERVVVRDRTNVRALQPDQLPFRPTLVVADLAFISLRVVVPVLRALATGDADHVLLVKPQFEVGADRVGRGGVVRDPEAWHRALAGVAQAAAREGLGLAGAAPSPLPGPAGNVEFFLHLHATRAGADTGDRLRAAVEEGRALGPQRSVEPGEGI